MNLRRIANVLGVVVLLALVIPFVVYAVPALVGADHSFIVLSGSMEPAISTGDAVVVAETDPASIEEGDVITYTRSGEETVVTHRVVGVQGEGGERAFRTQGDANDNPDQRPVPASNVIGTVVLTIPMIGYVVHFVGTPLGFGLLVVLPFGLLAVTEAWSFARAVHADGDLGSEGDGDRGRGGDDDRTSDGDDDPRRAGSGAALGHTVDGDGPDSVAIGAPSDRVDFASAPDRADSAATGAPGPSESGGAVTVPVGDLRLTTAVLIAMTPYAAYVAVQLQTFATIAVAFAVGFTALALGVLWLVVWHRASGGLGSLARRGGSDREARADGAAASEARPVAPDDRAVPHAAGGAVDAAPAESGTDGGASTSADGPGTEPGVGGSGGGTDAGGEPGRDETGGADGVNAP